MTLIPFHPTLYSVRLPNMGFLFSHWHFDVIPSKDLLVNWSPFLPYEEWRVGKHDVLCADLDISCMLHHNLFGEMATNSLTHGGEGA